MNLVVSPTGMTYIVYETKEEMYYNMFLEIGLFVNQQGYLQDTDTNITIRYKDKFIKVSLILIYLKITNAIDRWKRNRQEKKND